jgi:hypothetical protein
MGLWWTGAIVLLVVVLPVVIALLSRILGAVERIRDAVEEIHADAAALDDRLEPVPGLLATTDETIGQVKVGAVRYAGSVRTLLEG